VLAESQGALGAQATGPNLIRKNFWSGSAFAEDVQGAVQRFEVKDSAGSTALPRPSWRGRAHAGQHGSDVAEIRAWMGCGAGVCRPRDPCVSAGARLRLTPGSLPIPRPDLS